MKEVGTYLFPGNNIEKSAFWKYTFLYKNTSNSRLNRYFQVDPVQ
jgi:hypothetical protein